MLNPFQIIAKYSSMMAEAERNRLQWEAIVLCRMGYDADELVIVTYSSNAQDSQVVPKGFTQ